MNSENESGLFDELAELAQALDNADTEKERNEYFQQWKAELNNDDNEGWSISDDRTIKFDKPPKPEDTVTLGTMDTNKPYVEQEGNLTDFTLTTVNLVENPTDPYTTIAAAPPPPQNLIITADDCKEMVRIEFETGDVTFGEDYDVDEASRIFWESMGKDSPDKLKKEIEQLKAELISLQRHLPFVSAEQKEIKPLPVPKNVGLDDLAYFREKLMKAMSAGHSTEKLERQVALLEDNIAAKERLKTTTSFKLDDVAKQMIREGGWVEDSDQTLKFSEQPTAEDIVGVQPMTEPKSEIFKIRKRFSQQEAYKRAMEILD